MDMTRWSLRVRVFLFFLFLALATIGLIAGGLWFGWSRAVPRPEAGPFITGGIAAGFAVIGLVAWIWRLFDENLAHPLQAMAAQLRVLSQDAGGRLPASEARYLGDLAPAAQAISARMAEAQSGLAEAIARETTQMRAEKARLEALLADVSVGIIQCNTDHEVVFYNARARALLPGGATPLLGQGVGQCLNGSEIAARFAQLCQSGEDEAHFTCLCEFEEGEQTPLALTMRLLMGTEQSVEGYVLTLRDVSGPLPDRARSVYDFGLVHHKRCDALESEALQDLPFVIFDTETTGLLPTKGDEIVQIAGVRALGGRRIVGEHFETLVNPGRPIPEAATKIHGVTDRMVADAPGLRRAARDFHSFAEGAVLVAHNAPFDLAFFHKNRDAIGRRFDNPVIDTVLLSALLFGITEDHTLDAVCERLGITIPDALRHTAMGDAQATAEAFLKMLAMAQARGIETLGALQQGLDTQTRIYRKG